MTARHLLHSSALLAALAAGGFLSGCGGADAGTAPEEAATPTFEVLSAPEAKSFIENNLDVVAVDVSDYYLDHRIPGAYWYEANDGTFGRVLAQLDHDLPYLVYGFTGDESAAAAERMIAAGFERVACLAGGFIAWLDAGYPVETEYGCGCGS